MDGFIHSSSHSSIHPLTPVGEVFIPLKVRQGRSNVQRSIFVFLILTFVGPGAVTPGDRLVCPAFPPLEPNKQNEILVFFEICVFDCFFSFPYGAR